MDPSLQVLVYGSEALPWLSLWLAYATLNVTLDLLLAWYASRAQFGSDLLFKLVSSLWVSLSMWADPFLTEMALLLCSATHGIEWPPDPSLLHGLAYLASSPL